MRIVVVGASRVIGLAVADVLSAKGHEVLRTSRNAEVKVDIEDPAAVKSMCESMYEWVGKVDAVVSCAGDGAVKPLTKLTDAEIQFSLNSKLMGQVNLVRSGVEHVNDGGVFVRTAGVFGRKPLPGVPALAMVNGALESFSRARLAAQPPHQHHQPTHRQGDGGADGHEGGLACRRERQDLRRCRRGHTERRGRLRRRVMSRPSQVAQPRHARPALGLARMTSPPWSALATWGKCIWHETPS